MSGFVVSVVSFLAGITTLILKLPGVHAVPGWAAIVLAIALLGGAQLTLLGVMGEYVARHYEEVNRRPLYLVRDTVGLDGAQPEVDVRETVNVRVQTDC